MGTLTAYQVAQYAHAAGFTGTDLVTMVAICHAESAFNPRAFNGNVNTGDQSYGLGQVNMLGRLGPARRAEFGIASNDALFDPQTNLNACHRIFLDARNRFTPWSTYNHGSHKPYMAEATTAVAQLLRDLTPAPAVPPAEGVDPGMMIATATSASTDDKHAIPNEASYLIDAQGHRHYIPAPGALSALWNAGVKDAAMSGDDILATWPNEV